MKLNPKSTPLIYFLFTVLFLFNPNIYSQQSCIDLGTGINISNNEYALIDFFKNGGRWEPLDNTDHPWYKVYSLDTFKIVNGSYYHWDSDWSGTVNNEAWGDNWADCYISYYDMMIDQEKFDTNGYPLGFPLSVYKYLPKSEDPNQAVDSSKPVAIAEITRRIYFPEELPRSGWVMKWKGKGKISFQGLEDVKADTATTTALQGGESWRPDGYDFCGYDYDFESTDGGRIVTDLYYMIHGWVLNILESDPTDPIRDIVFLHPGLEDEYDAGEIFNPQFLERMQQFSSLRFMGYLESNHIEKRTRVSSSNPFHDVESLEWLRWEERTPENWYEISNGNGGNHEYIIKLANATGVDPWVNIPYCAGVAYTEELVNLYMENLDPDLELYLEVGNEMWNFASGFQGYHWQAAKRVFEYPGLGDVEGRGAHINMIFKKVTEVAGERNIERITRVYGAFPRYTDINNRSLSEIDPENWDAFATTWYFNLDEDTDEDDNNCLDPESGDNWASVLYNWHIENPTNQQGFNELYRDCLLNEFRCDGGYSDNSDVVLSKYYEKDIICYEGGNHTFYGCENAPTGGALDNELDFDTPEYPDYITDNSYINAICVADESEEMAEVYNEIIDSMQVAGISLANHLSFAGRSSCYGVWSFIQPRDMDKSLAYLLENYPKFRVFSERIALDNCDEVEVLFDTNTVGPGLSILLDGIDDYVTGQTTYVPDESSNYSLEAWFNPLFLDAEQAILSFSNDGANNNYNTVKVRADGKLIWEMGNNTVIDAKLIGPVIEAEKWNHVAVVKEGERYTMYLNGFSVASNNYSLSTVTRTNYTIGAIENNSAITNIFAGYIDEVRLWNVARSASDIRDYMCKKVPSSVPSYSNLRSYYRFDYPDYTSSQVYDHATASITGQLQNITFTPRSRYAISGAALGDYSRYRYASSWNGVSLSITHPDGDMLAISNIGDGAPDGVQVYIIEGESHYNYAPEYYDGISDERVFGVFMANGTTPDYDITYVYNGNPDALLNDTESNNRLLRRDMYSTEDWSHAGAEINLTANALSVACKENIRGEYTLAFRSEETKVRPGSGMALLNNQVPTEENYGLLRYLNLDDYTVTFWAKGWGNAFNFTQKLGNGAHRFNIGDNNGYVYCGLGNRMDWATGSQTIGTSTERAKIDEWVHYSITCSGTRIKIYVNGELVTEDDLLYPFTLEEMRLFHDPSWQDGNYSGGVCNLAIDELTVWNTALDQTTLQEWMCKKITDEHPYECENLVLYFNFDQGAGSILEDKRGSSDISLVSVAEGFNYITSGAAIGDVSIADYSTPENLSFVHTDGDYLEVNRTSGTSNGIHIYRTDNFPPVPSNTDNSAIVSMDSTRYWGVYSVKPYGVTATYSVTNNYENNSQVILANESELRLLSRFDNSDAPWSANSDTLPNTSEHTLTLAAQSRGEYVLGGTSENTFEAYTAPDQPVFVPETSAINNDTICGNSTGLVYAVENDPTVETYLWTIPEGLDGYSTTDTIVLNAAYSGTTSDTFTLSVIAVNAYGQSPADSFNILVLPAPTIADAGPDIMLIPPTIDTLMDGNFPGAGETGTWTLSIGGGTIANATNPNTTISDLTTGYNTFIWSISNSVCPASLDSMQITVAPPPQNVTLANGDPLPLIFCEGEIINVRAIPEEDIDNDGYQWTLPEGITLISQGLDTASLQVNSGIGGSILVAALYGGSLSENYETETININPLPNTPVFDNYTDVFCLNVDELISIQFDATIDSVEWTLPEGIYPVDWPKSTSEAITVQALSILSGHISAKAFNNGCASETAIDSFEVTVNEAPEEPDLFLGTDAGVADQFCADEYALLWVENNDTAATYEWTWDVNINLVEYLTDNNSTALFQMPDVNNNIYVRAVKGEGKCATSEWFNYNGWKQDVSPAVINSITITDPIGQDPLLLQVGSTYTFGIDGTGDYYYWDVPEGFEIVSETYINDDTNRILVTGEGAGKLDVYSISLKGCSSYSHSLYISTPGAIIPPEYVSGALTICQGTSLNIILTDVGASEYSWTLPNGTIYTTTTPELDVVVSTAMKGSLSVVATDGVYTTTPTLIAIEVQAINLSALGFVDESGTTIEELEICNGDSDRPIYHKDALASSYIWEIHGSAIQFEPRYEPGSPEDELLNRTSPVDTMMPVSWVNWRTQGDGSDDGFIVVKAINGCGGAHVSDSIYYYWQEPLDVIVPEFVQAPTELCVGSIVNYEIKDIDGADEYIWDLPNGLVATEIVTSVPSITANVVYGTGGSLSVYAKGTSCGGSNTFPQIVEPINIGGEAVDFYFVDEPLTACLGDSLFYSVKDIGATTYNWSVPGGLGYTTLDDSDDAGIIITGSWREESRDNMINQEYLYESNNSDRNIVYTPNLPYAGTYRINLSSFVRYNSVANMPVTITHKNGTETLYINTKLEPDDGIWRLIGDYEFDAGTAGSVTIATQPDGSGISIADAVRFEILSIPGGVSQTFPVNGTEGGAVCVSVNVPKCESDYTICSEPVYLGETLSTPLFTFQESSVCVGFEYEYRVTDIGADSYTWHLPTGMSIDGHTGIVTDLDRAVTISIDAEQAMPVQIGVNGMLASCTISSDTIFSSDITFDGIGCSACDTFSVAITDLEIINPTLCNETGTAIIHLQNAPDNQVYNIDYNFDGETDATGVVESNTITLENLPQDTRFTALVITEENYLCDVYGSDTGRIVSYTPALIDSIITVQPQQCGLNGSITIYLSGATNGDTYQIDYTKDEIYESSDILNDGILSLNNLTPGTLIDGIQIMNSSTQCISTSVFNDTIANPFDLSITDLMVQNPIRCDETGSLEIVITGGVEGDSYEIDLLGDGETDYSTTLQNDTLTVESLAIETEINNLQIIHVNSLCSATSTNSLVIAKPQPEETNLLAIDPMCTNSDTLLLNHGSPAGGTYSINETVVTNIDPQELGAGSFSLIYSLVDSNNCLAGDTITIVINPIPEALITGSDALCPHYQGAIYNTIANDNYSYNWQVSGGIMVNGERSSQLTVDWNILDTGLVAVSLINTETNCEASSSMQIIFTDTEPPMIENCEESVDFEAIFEGNWHYVLGEEDTDLLPQAYDNCSKDNIQWYFALNNADSLAISEFEGFNIEMQENQEIRWIAMDNSGNLSSCTTRLEFTIDTKPPTAFSPNGDGINDTWQIDFLTTYPESVVKVFNRWGNLVYESATAYPEPWDGKQNDRVLPVDTYYYIIDLGSAGSAIKGYVNLIY
jgi:gliding motility-associated-like protein